MKLFAVACLALAALSSPTQARIGESLEQCTDRYGPLVERRRADLPQSDPAAAVFSKNGVTIVVEFRAGTAWRIIFRKPKLSAIEVDALLSANSASGTWSTALRYGDREFRLCSDKKRLAVTTFAASSETSQIEILLREYSELWRANTLSRAIQSGAPEPGGRKINPLPGF